MLPDPADVIVYSIPLRNRFRGITVREGALWRGPAGWTEFSPFLNYDDATCVPWLRSALDVAEHGFPEGRRTAIPVNATVPAVDAVTAVRIVRESGGCRTVKVKVAEPGQSLDDDRDRVAAVRDALGPTGRIRVDVNGGWDVDTAVSSIEAIDRAAGGLEYVEQPCAGVDDLARVRRRVDVPIAADESIRRADDPLLVQQREAADLAVVKVQPLGGPAATLRLAESLTLPLVISSAVESSVGLAASLAVAAALPKLPYACGLNTSRLFESDLVTAPLVALDGVIAVPTVPPDPDRVDRYAADRQTRERWLHRIDAVAERLR